MDFRAKCDQVTSLYPLIQRRKAIKLKTALEDVEYMPNTSLVILVQGDTLNVNGLNSVKKR